MDNEPNQPLEDNNNTGKRKRSPGTSSDSAPEEARRASADQSQDVPGRKIAQVTPKRQRVGTFITEIDPSQSERPDSENLFGFSLTSLPVEVLQHTLSLLDPFSLGRLMCVNKYLHKLLGPSQELAEPSGMTTLPLLAAELIWLRSRKAHVPGMPHPLKSLTELDMFKLIYGKRCQKCGKSPAVSSTKEKLTPWNSGPGPRGVRTVWPFKIRVCAACLAPSLVKESEITLPEMPHVQTGALSAVFTPSLHYVMSITLTQTTIPPGLNWTKCYYREDVEAVLRSASEAQAIGETAYESWCRRMNASLQEAFTDVVRLEAWELAQKASSDQLAIPSNMTSRSSASGSSVRSDTVSRSFFTASSGGYRALTATTSQSGLGHSRLPSTHLRYDSGLQRLAPQAEIAGSRHALPTSHGHMVPPTTPDSLDETVRAWPDPGSYNVIRLKGEKRADLQQRCMELDPPIPPHILDRLPAFQSALQVLMPIDETTWEKLKIELLAQRRATELLHSVEYSAPSRADIMETSTVWREATPIAEPQEIDLRREASRPVREKLKDFAREYVYRHYAGGTGLTYSSAPQFAADVLLYVRDRFYQNQRLEDEAFAAQGEQPPDEGPSGARTRTLKLEHMRYVFNNSIEQFTDLIRKDLFLCSACDTQGRYFQFEAIIQHFASKHTDSFSRDKAVVSWKAEWPLQPPFEPKPGKELDPSSSVSYPPSTSQLAVPPRNALSRFPAPMPYVLGPEGDSTHVLAQQPHESWRNRSRIEEPPHVFDRHRHGSMPETGQLGTSGASRPYYTPGNHYEIFQSDRPVGPNHPISFATAPIQRREEFDYVRYYRRNLNLALPESYSQGQQQVDIPMTEADTGREIRYDRIDPRLSEEYYTDRSEQPYIEYHDNVQRGFNNRSSPYERYQGVVQQVNIPENRATPQRRVLSVDGRPTDSPSRNSRASSTHHQSDFDPHRGVASGYGIEPQRNAAERFLDDFNIDSISGRNKESPQSTTVTHSSRPRSRGAPPRGQTTLARVPTDYQPQRNVRRITSLGDRQLPSDTDEFYGVPRYDSEHYDTTFAAVRRNENTQVYQSDSHYYEREYDTTQPSRVRYFEEITDHPRLIERRYPQQQTRYIDRFGQEIHSISPEARYAEPYREVRVERPWQYSGSQPVHARYDYMPYDQQDQPPSYEARQWTSRRSDP